MERAPELFPVAGLSSGQPPATLSLPEDVQAATTLCLLPFPSSPRADGLQHSPVSGYQPRPFSFPGAGPTGPKPRVILQLERGDEPWVDVQDAKGSAHMRVSCSGV